MNKALEIKAILLNIKNDLNNHKAIKLHNIAQLEAILGGLSAGNKTAADHSSDSYFPGVNELKTFVDDVKKNPPAPQNFTNRLLEDKLNKLLNLIDNPAPQNENSEKKRNWPPKPMSTKRSPFDD